MAFQYEQEIFGVICSFFVLCMVVVCALEIRAWLRKKTVISGRQLIVRLAGGLLMLGLLLRLLYGIYWVEYQQVDAEYFLQFWAGSVGLAYLCLALASVDMLRTIRLRRASRGARKRIAERLEDISKSYSQSQHGGSAKPGNSAKDPQSPIPGS